MSIEKIKAEGGLREFSELKICNADLPDVFYMKFLTTMVLKVIVKVVVNL